METMEHLAPLIQTVLWVVLLAGIVWRFNKPLHGLLVALQKRVEGGSTIKAGPFEISQQLRPQDPTSQKAKIGTEIKELRELAPHSWSGGSSISTDSLQGRYFQAEDLALRAVQYKYGVSINRQVTGGNDVGFDGVFSFEGQLYIVEVKYFSVPVSDRAIRSSFEKLIHAVQKYGWRNVKILLVLVRDGPGRTIPEKKKIDEIIGVYPIPIETLIYNLEDLERQFGISES